MFTCIYLVFLYRVYTLQPQTWIADKVRGKGWFRDWRALAGALCISCIGILVSLRLYLLQKHRRHLYVLTSCPLI